ncbi:LCP family protein [uncultured Tyzzerella sp.]|uniref:LCP family protein n=1 Tax=uncultured Tyzzerella sp. TaxID=2321398 RepID=UPI002942E7A2|nr:LCP family protein [uncultured Tyzzerella sp.]
MKNKNKKGRKKRKKKSLTKRFFKIVFSILTVYFIGVVCFFVYAFISNEPSNNNTFVNKVVDKVAPKPPERTLALIACTDEAEGRTDGIMLVGYNSVNNQISVVSIPRDTKVSIPPDMWQVMVKNEPIIANDNPSFKKINSIPNYGKERGMEFLQRYLEDLLDVKIDYYAHFNFEGFKYIIDSVGGIEFDVPQRMHYSDPTQDLYINLQPGLQLLDGDKAEQLLRFRKDNNNVGYARGDLQRVEVQQAFMTKFFEKVLSIDSIISNPKSYITTLTKYIDTNFTISDALKYVGEVKEVDISNTQTYTIPCTTKSISGISFVIVDEQEVKEFAYEVFKKPTINPEDIVYEDSFDKSIQILNGSYTSGLAGKTKELLEDNGYIIGDIGDSQDTKSEETKIYVSDVGQGNDLQKFFTKSKIVVNPQKVQDFGYDITIVIGTGDELKDISTQISDNTSSN